MKKTLIILAKGLNYISLVFVGCCSALIAVDVFLRYVFNKPLIGTAEIISVMMVMVTFCGVSWAAVQDKMLIVDLFKYRGRGGLLIDTGTYFIGAVLIGVLSWRAWVGGLSAIQLNRTTSIVMPIPEAPFYFVISVGCGLLFFIILMKVVEKSREAFKK